MRLAHLQLTYYALLRHFRPTSPAEIAAAHYDVTTSALNLFVASEADCVLTTPAGCQVLPVTLSAGPPQVEVRRIRLTMVAFAELMQLPPWAALAALSVDQRQAAVVAVIAVAGAETPEFVLGIDDELECVGTALREWRDGRLRDEWQPSPRFGQTRGEAESS